MIIIEGMDNTGKSTLAKSLSKILKIPYIHSEKPSSLSTVYKNMTEVILKSPCVVRDRINPISEMIYGTSISGKSLMEKVQWGWIDAIMRSGALLIYCRPPSDTVLKFGEREQMEGVIDNATQMLKMYDWVFKQVRQEYPGRIMYYDYTGKPGSVIYSNREEIIRRCISQTSMRENRIKKISHLENQWLLEFKEDTK